VRLINGTYPDVQSLLGTGDEPELFTIDPRFLWEMPLSETVTIARAGRRQLLRGVLGTATFGLVRSGSVGATHTAGECHDNGERCASGDQCCSGRCKRQRGTTKKFCRQAPHQGTCTVEQNVCEQGIEAGTACGSNCFCKATIDGRRFCGDGGVGACTNCESHADCREQVGDKRAVCVRDGIECCGGGTLCTTPCPDLLN
jgi:hypothetical protein